MKLENLRKNSTQTKDGQCNSNLEVHKKTCLQTNKFLTHGICYEPYTFCLYVFERLYSVNINKIICNLHQGKPASLLDWHSIKPQSTYNLPKLSQTVFSAFTITMAHFSYSVSVNRIF